MIFNPYHLNFDKSTAILRDLSVSGYNVSDLTPVEREGYDTSYKSVINHMFTDPYDLIYGQNSNILKLNEDYKLGNYQLSLKADLDIYLELNMKVQNDYGRINFYLKGANIAACYVPETLCMGYDYGEDEYNLYSNKLTINYGCLTDTLHLYFL